MAMLQGSGIGPLMNWHILEEFNIKVKLFADDVKMYV